MAGILEELFGRCLAKMIMPAAPALCRVHCYLVSVQEVPYLLPPHALLPPAPARGPHCLYRKQGSRDRYM